MSAVQKFMFDRTFDVAAQPAPKPEPLPIETSETEADEQEPDAKQEEEESQPGYSEEQLEAAKKDSFEAGKQEGILAATKTVEQETLVAVRSIAQHLTELFGNQEHSNTTMMKDSVGVAATIVRKLFPAMDETYGLEEVERLIEHTLLRLIEEPRVVIKVNPALTESLGARLHDLKAGAGYEGRIVLKEDASMNAGDCRLEWGDGSAERNVAALWQSIDDIIESNIGIVTPNMNSGVDVDVTSDGTDSDDVGDAKTQVDAESQDELTEEPRDNSAESQNETPQTPQESTDSEEVSIEGVEPAQEPDIVEDVLSNDTAESESMDSSEMDKNNDANQDQNKGVDKSSERAGT